MEGIEPLPQELEVTGSELSEIAQTIQSKGGFVSHADVVGLSSYRLSIVWPVVEGCDVSRPIEHGNQT